MAELPLLTFAAVSKEYGRQVAVDRISFDVRDGEFLTLLGPSGSGKSTLLSMVAGFVRPTSGDILFSGSSIVEVPPHRRDFGFVFQHYALFPHMSVNENVAFPLRMRKMSNADVQARVKSALGLVDLPGLGRRRPNELSGGQQQRVALARALVYEPQLLLMDEPLAALDRGLRDRLQGELRRIQQQLGITVVYVTHDQDEAFTLSDRIAVIHLGKLQQLDTGRALYELPISAFVASFVGDSNLLSGSVTNTGDAFRVAETSLVVPLAGHALEQASTLHASASLMVRPDRIRLKRSTETTVRPGEFAVTGVVESTSYLGFDVKYVVALATGSRSLVCRVASSEPLFAPGDGVVASWLVGDAVLVDGSG